MCKWEMSKPRKGRKKTATRLPSETAPFARSKRRSVYFEASARPALTLRRKRNPPKVLRRIVLLDKLDGVSRDSLSGSHLRDDPGRNLGTTIVFHNHDRPDHQLTLQLDRRPMPIQIGSSSSHRKGTLLTILTREPHRTV